MITLGGKISKKLQWNLRSLSCFSGLFGASWQALACTSRTSSSHPKIFLSGHGWHRFRVFQPFPEAFEGLAETSSPQTSSNSELPPQRRAPEPQKPSQLFPAGHWVPGIGVGDVGVGRSSTLWRKFHESPQCLGPNGNPSGLARADQSIQTTQETIHHDLPLAWCGNPDFNLLAVLAVAALCLPC